MLKLILIGLTPIIAMVQMLLDHKWHDRRTNWHKVVLRTLVVLMFLSAVGAVAVEYMDRRQVEAQQQEIRKKMLEHISTEFSWNYEQIKIKGGSTFGLIVKPPQDSESLHTLLFLMRAGSFHKDVPKVWTQDLKSLLVSHIAQEEAAARAVFNMYDAIDRTEEEESRLMNSISNSNDRKDRDEQVRMLHLRYEAFALRIRKGCTRLGTFSQHLETLGDNAHSSYVLRLGAYFLQAASLRCLKRARSWSFVPVENQNLFSI